MMGEKWTLTKKFTFAASHRLPNHDGACKRLHGHTWGVEIELTSGQLQDTGPSVGMLIDFGEVKNIVGRVIGEFLDHRDLNSDLGIQNPTSEVLAKWLYEKLFDDLSTLTAVTIFESPTSKCRYERDV